MRAAVRIVLLLAAFVVLPQLPGCVLPDPPGHALSHLLAGAVAAALAVVLAPLAARTRIEVALRGLTLAALAGVALFQALEAVSAYTEAEGAGWLHTSTSLATMACMMGGIVPSLGWAALRMDRRHARWAVPLAVVAALVALLAASGALAALVGR